MADFLTTTIDKFLFKIASDRLYSAEGVWLLEESGRIRVGVTDYQQQLGGDVAFAHIKPTGTILSVGDEAAELETIKATVSFASPISGTVVEVNAALELSPETINDDPYGKGWLLAIDPANWLGNRTKLLNPEAYLAAMRKQAEEALGQS